MLRICQRKTTCLWIKKTIYKISNLILCATFKKEFYRLILKIGKLISKVLFTSKKQNRFNKLTLTRRVFLKLNIQLLKCPNSIFIKKSLLDSSDKHNFIRKTQHELINTDLRHNLCLIKIYGTLSKFWLDYNQFSLPNSLRTNLDWLSYKIKWSIK